MQTSLQITFRGMEPSNAVRTRLEERVADLERFATQLTSCRVTVDAPPRHHQHGGVYTIHVDLRLPDGHIVVGHEHGHNHAHEDVYVAIRDAFAATTRQVEDFVRRQRGDVKTSRK